MAKDRGPLPDFPTMKTFSDPLREASEKRGDSDFQFLLYGQAAALNRELPAAELMERLIDEAQRALKSQS